MFVNFFVFVGIGIGSGSGSGSGIGIGVGIGMKNMSVHVCLCVCICVCTCVCKCVCVCVYVCVCICCVCEFVVVVLGWGSCDIRIWCHENLLCQWTFQNKTCHLPVLNAEHRSLLNLVSVLLCVYNHLTASSTQLNKNMKISLLRR